MRSLSLLLAAAATAAAWSPPLYRQCDPRWGNMLMGVKGNGERNTICAEGCAMTSVSMALAGLGVTLNGAPVNPGSMNAWLEDHKGYLCMAGDCNNLRLDAPDDLTARLALVGEAPKPPLAQVQQALKAGTAVFVAHVHSSGHFVLVTGWNATAGALAVNDPFYNSTTYPYDAVSDMIQYAVSPPIVGGEGQAARAALEGPSPTAVIPFTYPLYKQCDPRWGKDIIVSTTVCAVGCLMSSTSMAIGGKGIPIAGGESNPGTLNSWLKANGGYTSGNDLIESDVPHINPAHISWPADAMHPTNNLPVSAIIGYLRAGRPVIANVMHGHHFVLVTGWEPAPAAALRGGDPDAGVDTLYVNDPGFDRNTYSYSADVVGWRLFNMTSINATMAA